MATSNRSDIAIEMAEAIASMLEENRANKPPLSTADEGYDWAVTTVRIFASALRAKARRPRKRAEG